MGLGVRFSWPDASRDVCLRCATQRQFHGGEDHKFVEREGT